MSKMEQPEKINWGKVSTEIKGLTENAAEEYLIARFGRIPSEWNDPLFRDEIRGRFGDAELNAHMNDGELKYGDESRHGEYAAGIWHHRNIWKQGHPAESNWMNHERNLK